MIIPDPVVENEDNSLSDTGLKFLAQYYGYQRMSKNVSSTRYGAHPDMVRLPDSVMNLPLDRLRTFIVRMYAAQTGRCYKHYSGAGRHKDHPEIWFRCRHREFAVQFQWLLLRLRLKSRITYHKKMQMWVVTTSGIRTFIRIRPIIKEGRNPVNTKKIRELEALIPSSWKPEKDDGRVWDDIKTIEFLD